MNTQLGETCGDFDLIFLSCDGGGVDRKPFSAFDKGWMAERVGATAMSFLSSQPRYNATGRSESLGVTR